MRVLMAAALLVLTACSPKPPPEDAPARQPVAVVSDFSHDMDARGTEPFWSLKIRGGQFTLTRPGLPDLTATASGAEIVPGRAVWNATSPDGRTLKVTLYVSNCSDGMSDVSYPLAAEVEAPDVTMLSGCAVRAR
jgi:uncharacterized membrane protein